MRGNHTWPASTPTVMGKAECKVSGERGKKRKDEKISGSGARPAKRTLLESMRSCVPPALVCDIEERQEATGGE